MKLLYYIPILMMLISSLMFAQNNFDSDTINTANGSLQMTFIGHGTLMFKYDDEIIHIDPVSRYGDYSKMPDADLILITHNHGDHLDPEAIKKITTSNTSIICTENCKSRIDSGTVMQNGDIQTIQGIRIQAVPAYNIVHKREETNEPFHPKGAGNGYVLTFGDKKIYVAGDTENIPEMKKLENIDIAFLPMNVPYTMTPEMVVDAVNKVKPKILYPYHYGNTDVNQLLKLMENNKQCEVRIRDLR